MQSNPLPQVDIEEDCSDLFDLSEIQKVFSQAELKQFPEVEAFISRKREGESKQKNLSLEL